MKKNLQEKLLQRKIKKPNVIIGLITLQVLKHLAKKRHTTFEYVGDVKDYLRKPAIMVAQHCAREEFIYTLAGFPKHDIHCVMGYQNFFNKKLYHLLPRVGVIPKYLYQPDTLAVRKMLRIVRSGRSLLLYPEGIQSTSGSTQPINPASAKFLKQCGLPIILCTSHGSYLTRPRYSAVKRYGQMTFKYEVLITADECAKLTADEIYQKLIAAFKYNEFEYNRTAKIAFRGAEPNITGLDNIIFRCPHCNTEFAFKITGDTMTCTHCGASVTMDEYYQLHSQDQMVPFDDIDKWYQWQRRTIRDAVADPNFKLTVPVKIGALNLQKLKNQPDIVGTGTLTFTQTQIVYQGAYKSETVQFNFDIYKIPSMPFAPSDHSIEMIYDNQYYYFVPTAQPLQAVKLMLVAEELHNRVDDAWRQASEDVYEY